MQLKKFPDSRWPSLSGLSHGVISYFARATRSRPDIDVPQSYPDDCQRHFDMIISITWTYFETTRTDDRSRIYEALRSLDVSQVLLISSYCLFVVLVAGAFVVAKAHQYYGPMYDVIDMCLLIGYFFKGLALVGIAFLVWPLDRVPTFIICDSST